MNIQSNDHPVDKDEINLFDLSMVIWRRKLFIIALFLISVVITAVVSYSIKPVYRVSASFSSGTFYDTTGNMTNIESPENIMSIIQSGSFNPEIIKSLNLDPRSSSNIVFKVQIPKGSNIITLNYETVNPAEGEKVISELLRQLAKFYAVKAVDMQKDKASTTVKALENEISKTESKKEQTVNEKKKISSDIQLLKDKAYTKKEQTVNEKKKISSDIQLLKDKIKLLKETEINLDKQKQDVEDNSKKLMVQRDELLKQSDKSDKMSIVLYSNTLQQNIAYLNQLRESIYKNKFEQESAKNEIEKMELKLLDKDLEMKDLDTKTEIEKFGLKIKDKDLEIKNIDIDLKNTKEKIESTQLDKDKITGIRVIQNPIASAAPVKPRKKFNVALAGMASLFAGAFLAFFLEFLSKAKNKASSSP